MIDRTKIAAAKLRAVAYKGCHVRVCIQGVLGPEYVDGTFDRFEPENAFTYIHPAGWRDVCSAHVSQAVEIDRIKL